MEFLNEYKLWCEKVTDEELLAELKAMEGAEPDIEDAFYRELEFGTAGLRGVIGAGTNRMNIYTVAKASQGLANYVNENFSSVASANGLDAVNVVGANGMPNVPSIAIAYDSRIKSDLFARIAAGVFAANGIKVHIWKNLMPVPTLSYAVRNLGCQAGIVVTASHNPSKYNGYKVYGADGCQITTKASEDIYEEIKKIDIFDDVKTVDFVRGMENGMIEYIPDSVYASYLEEVKKQSMLYGEKVNKDVAIVYSPLNGSGLVPVTDILRETGYTNITIVKEQEKPDGNFPTCPYPNPEIREAMELGIQYAKEHNADLLLATDPDCDRVGIAVKDEAGEYVLLTGNQTGALLLDYICRRRAETGNMPSNPVFAKTIVTTDLCEKIAASYGVRTKNLLTGFKYIGELIGELEASGKEDSYILGFEESYGYLSGSYVRDKDAVNGAFLICEMFCYYKSKGISLLKRLNSLYERFGYYLNKVHSYGFEGAAGFQKMQEVMKAFREIGTDWYDLEIIGCPIYEVIDYNEGIDNLPKSNVLKFVLANDSTVIVRPSGTEPKIKLYMSVKGSNQIEAKAIDEMLKTVFEKKLV